MSITLGDVSFSLLVFWFFQKFEILGVDIVRTRALLTLFLLGRCGRFAR